MRGSKFAGFRVSVLTALILAVAVVLPANPATAQTLMSEAAARTALEEEFGVQVLRIDAGEQDGVPVFVVRVMNPGGNFNEAFQVTVLVFDRQTGKLVPQFRHEPSGVRDTAGAPNDANDNSGPILRRESVR